MTGAADLVTLLPNQALFETWAWGDWEGVDPFLVTLRCVARWADRCAIWPLGSPGAAGYEGGLPADPAARDALLERAWTEAGDWWEREVPGYRLVAALLWSGEQQVLDNHDATWASDSEIRLAAGQVDQLRDYWRRHGVPADLYVPGRSPADRRRDDSSRHGTAHG